MRSFLVLPTLVLAYLFFASTSATAAPVFIVAYGTSLDVSDQPVSGSHDYTQDDPFGAPGVQVSSSATAGPGQLKLSSQVTILSNSVAPTSAEVRASFSGAVYICGNDAGGPNFQPGVTAFDPANCENPGNVPLPYPDIAMSGSFDLGQGAFGAYIVSVVMNQTPLYNEQVNVDSFQGDEAGTINGTTGSHFTGSTGTVPLLNCAIVTTPCISFTSVGVSVGVVCLQFFAPCTAVIDMSETIEFVQGQDAFLGLAPGISIWSPDLNIYDNRWYSPEYFLAASSISEPATLSLLGLGIFGFGLTRLFHEGTRAKVAGVA